MKIFRVESVNGKGPFYMNGDIADCDANDYYYACTRHFDNDTHRVPNSAMHKDDLISGCTSLEHLSQWFSNEMLDIIKKYQYRISVYNVKAVVHHVDPSVTNQITFKKKNAVLIETLALDSLRV